MPHEARNRNDIEKELERARRDLEVARAHENTQGGSGGRRERRAECVQRVEALQAEWQNAPPVPVPRPESPAEEALRTATLRLQEARQRENTQGGGDGRRQHRACLEDTLASLQAKVDAETRSREQGEPTE